MGAGTGPSTSGHSSQQRPFTTMRPRLAADDLRSSSSMVCLLSYSNHTPLSWLYHLLS